MRILLKFTASNKSYPTFLYLIIYLSYRAVTTYVTANLHA